MLRIITPYFIICSSLMHIFCCGIPLLLSITSLASIVGISSLGAFEIMWFEAIEEQVLILSGIMLLGTFLIDWLSKKLDCLKEGTCKHSPCDKKKNKSSLILKVAIILYATNLITLSIHTITA